MVEQPVVLPTHAAVEAALMCGEPADQLRATVVTPEELGMPTLQPDLGDNDIADHPIRYVSRRSRGPRSKQSAGTRYDASTSRISPRTGIGVRRRSEGANWLQGCVRRSSR